MEKFNSTLHEQFVRLGCIVLGYPKVPGPNYYNIEYSNAVVSIFDLHMTSR